ncbi:MAG: hypothetical protein ABI747_02685 [Candidatus Moraniibacteriota bacterium]
MSETKLKTDFSEAGVSRHAFSRRQLMGIGLFFPLALFSYFSWRSVFEAALLPGGSTFFLPLFYFSLLIVLFALGSVLWEGRSFPLLAAAIVFLPGLFFASSIAHFLFMGVGVFFAYHAIGKVQHELHERVHLSFRRSILFGLPVFLLGLSIVLSSQYYVHAQALSWERLVPSFDLGEGTGAWVLRVMGPLYPPLRTLQNEEVTVDTFLKEMRTNDSGKIPDEELPLEVKAILEEQGIQIESLSQNPALQEAILAGQRENFSKLLGRQVGGDEKMGTVLSEVLRKKTLTFISGTQEYRGLPVPVLPFILSVLLFLTVYPTASFLLPIWSGVAHLLFLFLLRIRVIQIGEASVMQERLEG